MPKLIKKRSAKAGLPPGTLVHIGEVKNHEIKITVMDFDETNLQELTVKTPEECFQFRDKKTITWINVEGIQDLSALEKICTHYGVHPLAMEDIANTDQRPKTENFSDNFYIVLKMLFYDELKNEVIAEQVSIILGSNFLISFQEGIEGDAFNPIRERIRNNKSKIRKKGVDYLAYSLLDAIVDNYFVILEKLGERIETLENNIIKNPAVTTVREIYRLKRETVFLRKFIWPLREVISNLERTDSALLGENIKIYLRDVYDHTIQVMDTVETFRDILSGLVDIYLSNINNKTNNVMKVLAVITTIFTPPILVAGVYGMNFKYLPELEWIYGYPMALILMVFSGLLMFIYFRRKKWL